MTSLVALLTLSMVTLTLGSTPWCSDLVSDLVNEDEGVWSATLNVPLTKNMAKLTDHWQMKVTFSKPISDMTVNSVQLSSGSETIRSDGATSTFVSTSLQGTTTWRQVDDKTVEIRQETHVDPQTFLQKPAVILRVDLSLKNRQGDKRTSVSSITCNNVPVCG